MSENRNKIDRRNFLKILGGGAAVTAASLVGCGPINRSRGGVATAEVPTDKMTVREDPKTGAKVSLLGYGCMRFPTLPTPEKDGNVVDQQAVNDLFDYAIAHGVNYFDTSPVYMQGWSEKATGTALNRHPRDSYYLATKMSNFSNYTRENSIAMYRKSMELMHTDYFDYYLVHNVGSSMESFNNRFIDNGILDFLIEERKAGRIRNLGWSFHGNIECFDQILALHEEVHWDFIQIQLNYCDWKYAKGNNINAEYLYAELTKRGIPAIIMEPLLGGRLAKLPDYLAVRLKQNRPEQSVASWAFRYSGSFPNVLTVLSGMTYLEHLQDNILTYAPLDELSDEEMELLADTSRLMMEYDLLPCTGCQYCMPCPYGIDIPAIFLHYNRCICEDNIPESSQDDNYRQARRAFLIGYDRSVPKLRQADHCIGCDQCVVHCPQAIKIPQELARIDDYAEKLKQGTL